MEGLNFEQVGLILLIAAIVTIIARRFRIPYTVGLVLAGIFIGVLPLNIEINLSKELLFKVLLPPLIFEAALYINWKELRKDLSVVLMFATVGVLLSAGVTALLMHFLIGWTWQEAAIFGVLIAATDPVSVIATFKEAGVEGRLRLLVEAESLFNDATAAVGFAVAVAFALGESFGFASAIWMMFLSVVGGVICGLLVGGAVLLFSTRTQDHLVEIALTTIAAFGSFWLAEHFHLSGILATMTAGLLVGNTSSLKFISHKGAESIESFWEFAAFVANSIVFIVLGINTAYQDFADAILPVIAAILAVIVGRAIAIYPCSALFAGTSLKIDKKHQHVLFWGGLRGALALALALGIPNDLPYRREIILVTFGVVAFSIFAQGLTMTPFLRRLGQIPHQKEV
jgi:CPA1 family monovalent cation:H+ antiporter